MFEPKHILFLLTTLGLLSACVPAEKKQACGANEVLNETLRTCVSAAAFRQNNNKPQGINQEVTAIEDTDLDFDLTPGTDLDGDTLFYVPVTLPTHGVLTNCMTFNGSTGVTDKTCTYLATTNYYGTDSYTYKVNDGQDDGESIVRVSITITPVNDAPTLVNIYPTIIEDISTAYTLNYSDPEGSLGTSCSVHTLSNILVGACTCNAQGVCKVTISPDANENSNYAQVFGFYASVTTGSLTSNSIHEIITITAKNDTPLITAPTGCTTTQDHDIAFSCTANPIVVDPELAEIPAQTHTWALNSTNTCAWAAINTSTGVLSGTPNDDQVGTCNVVFKVTDSLGATRVSLPIAVTVNNVLPNLTPTTALIVPTEDAGTQLVGVVSSDTVCTAAFCLTGDHLPFGTLSLGSNTDCSNNGTMTLAAINSTNTGIYFTPNANYASSNNCTIEVTFSDGNGGLAAADSVMTVQEINDTPTMSPASISNQSTNESTYVLVDADTSTAIIDPMTIDEGGGTDENIQNLTIEISSSNTALIPHSVNNIHLFSDANMTSPYNFVSATATKATFNTTDGDNDLIYMAFTPLDGVTGTSTITVTVTDNGTTNAVAAPLSISKTFTITATNKKSQHRDWNDIYAVGAKVLYDGTISSNPQVRLQWNAFTAVNDTVAGYWVYRSTTSTGPFLIPINATALPVGTRTYTDSSLTDIDAGVTYYYKVMAISSSNGKVLNPVETYSTIKINIPFHNMALVHRRMVNLGACKAINSLSDPENNNRCGYVGPGDNYSTFFDIGSDHFVDRYEASCNYTVSTSACTETGGVGCIGSSIPTAFVTTSIPAIYYNRLNGSCHYFTGGSWVELANLTTAQLNDFQLLNQTDQSVLANNIESTFPKRPPLVRLQQFKANNYCNNITPPGFGAKSLLSRPLHVAAAEWSTSTENIGPLEAGTTLNLTSSQCNSSDGGALSFQNGYISALFDTWTATEASSASSHSFVMAGSDVTANCKSRYGIQDLVGNVEEWNLDRFFNSDNSNPNELMLPVGSNLPVTVSTTSFAMLEPSYNPYSFLSFISPGGFIIADIPANINFSISSRIGAAGLTDIFLPFGLIVNHAGTDSKLPIEDLAASIFNDDFHYMSTEVTSGNVDFILDDNELAALSSGGNFNDGTGAGRYTLRYRTVCHDSNDDNDCIDAADITANGTEENVFTGFRCMLKVP